VAEEADRKQVAEEHRRLGELLRHCASHLPRGAREVTVTEYSAEGPKEVKIALDPSRDAKSQMERHFHLYRRLLRGAERAKERLRELEAELAQVEAELSRVMNLERAELEQEPTPQVKAAPKGVGEPRLPYREYRSASGQVIWVGKGGADNDALTFGRARPEHWWFHARGVSGAHVVVPLPRQGELGPELLLDASHLALHHSEHKREAHGEVSYTRVKFVRKAKGGMPGQVTYTRERTFWLRVEPERLRRLLANG
jgi:predicted ribosome quality control (RQC) complex YloA/Tae2 family protein